MTFTALLSLVPVLIGMAAGDDRPRIRSFVVQDELVMKVPVQPLPRDFEWVAVAGPRCINPKAIRGAFLSGSDSVDLITVRNRRIRAELSTDCPALDFYGDFYLKPEDEKICAKRDVVRSRMGGTCPIERFHWLVPKRRSP